MCAAIPYSLQAELDEFEKAMLFTARCYKDMTTILTGDNALKAVVAILDTGAGPKFVQ